MRRRLWLWWTLASGVAGAMTAAMMGFLVGFPLFGLFLGLPQALVLRRPGISATRWLLVTAVGGLLFFLSLLLVAPLIPGWQFSTPVMLAHLAVAGAVIGWLQVRVLKGSVSRPGWWILASSLGLALLWAVELWAG
jgi:hypothetical protein